MPVQRLFASAIFFSAALLFMVQPLTGKIFLPVLGGSPAVWSMCMLFFQGLLFLGYVYAHLLSTRVAPRWQLVAHAGVLIAASLMLPIPIDIGPGDADPRRWLAGALTRTVGLPFFALSATAPLLQQWFSRTSDRGARDPYFLYAASNAGSLLGLLGYLFVEPLATRTSQARGWSLGFWIVAALIVACAYRVGARRTGTLGTGTVGPPGAPSLILWIALAFVPSALLLGVTQHLTTDVVSAPLLWVVPLALYLLTFIAAFSKRNFGTSRRWGSIAPFATLVVLVLLLLEVRYPIVPIAVAHLAVFAVLAMMCHTRLAETRPDPAHLTAYFVCVSLGGVIGGAAVALAAPALFSSILEYPLAIGAAMLLRPQIADYDNARAPQGRWLWPAAAAVLFVAGFMAVSSLNESENDQRLARAALAIPAVVLLMTPKTALLFAGTAAGLLAGASVVRTGGEVLYRERTFFGVHEVTSQQNGDWHVLTHGTTTHGIQAFRGKLRMLPTAYYHPTGPIGDVVFMLSPEGRFRSVGVIGLGAGAMAAYAGAGVRMDFFEIDEAVIRIAANPRYFTHLADAMTRPGTTIRTMAVDGRLGLQSMPRGAYDALVIDAFSSDAIPTHLVTKEAIELFASRLGARGVMAFHVSSRFFDLAPVLARIADGLGFVCYARDDRDVPPERAAEAKRPSVWVVLARDQRDLGQIPQSGPRWVRLPGGRAPLWTDDYSNVLYALGY